MLWPSTSRVGEGGGGLCESTQLNELSVRACPTPPVFSHFPASDRTTSSITSAVAAFLFFGFGRASPRLRECGSMDPHASSLVVRAHKPVEPTTSSLELSSSATLGHNRWWWSRRRDNRRREKMYENLEKKAKKELEKRGYLTPPNKSGAQKWYIIDPRQSRITNVCDTVTALGLLFTLVATPFEVSFLSPAESIDGLFVLNRLVDVIFIMDMFLQFLLMYPTSLANPDGSRWEDDPRTIAYNYLTGWFAIDVVSIATSAFDVYALAVVPAMAADGASATSSTDEETRALLSRLKILRTIRVLRLVKVCATSMPPPCLLSATSMQPPRLLHASSSPPKTVMAHAHDPRAAAGRGGATAEDAPFHSHSLSAVSSACSLHAQVVRLLKTSRMLKRWETKVSINYGVVAITRVGFFTICLAHWSASLWTLQV